MAKKCEFANKCLNCMDCMKSGSEISECEILASYTHDILRIESGNLFSEDGEDLFNFEMGEEV